MELVATARASASKVADDVQEELKVASFSDHSHRGAGRLPAAGH